MEFPFTINKNIIKEDQYKIMEEGWKTLFMRIWKVRGTLHRPKENNKNS